MSKKSRGVGGSGRGVYADQGRSRASPAACHLGNPRDLAWRGRDSGASYTEDTRVSEKGSKSGEVC